MNIPYVLDLSNESAIGCYLKVAEFFNDEELKQLCKDRIKSLLKKDLGKVVVVDIKYVPIVKDAEKDSIDIWEQKARKEGIILTDIMEK